MNSNVSLNCNVGEVFTHIPIPRGGDQFLRFVGECGGIPFEYFLVHRPNEMSAYIIDEGDKIILP